MLQKSLYLLTYYLLHITLQTYYICRIVWRYFQILFLRNNLNPLSHIRYNISNFSKVPKHLAIVIDESEHRLEELAQVIGWSLAAEIQYLTIYDFNGRLKDDYKKLQNHVETFKHKLFVDDLEHCPEVIFCFATTPISSTSSKTPRTVVRISSLEDGRWRILESIKGIARSKVEQNEKLAIENKEKEVEEIPFTPISIQKYNQLAYPTSFDVPDPELMLVFGPMNSTAGFSPWHLRLTELAYLGTLKRIHCSIYVSALAKYSGIEQRFGK